MRVSNLLDDTTKRALDAAVEESYSYLASLPYAAAGSNATTEQLRARLSIPLNDDAIDPEQVVRELCRAVDGGLNGNAGGRFFGWVVGGALPGALAADWLTSTWDQVPGVYAVSPAASVAEEVAGYWLLQIFGLPQECGFAFVTGCQMAHVTCIAAARHRLLAGHGWDVERRGLWDAPKLRILTGAHRHGTIDRAVRILGMGSGCVIDLPVNQDLQLLPETLENALKNASQTPTVVVLQAGDVNCGRFDPFADLIPLAKRYGAWVHIDGAFGLWAAASPRLDYLTHGVQEADSWASDGHKWLNVPYDAGYAFVRERAAHVGAFSHRAVYLQQSDAVREPMDFTPEHSRRARGFTTYAALRSLGRNGVARLVERCCDHAARLVALAAELERVCVVSPPVINQALLRFQSPKHGATEAEHDSYTDEVIDRIRASGEALFTATVYQGRRCMRISISSHQTTSDDIDRAVAALDAALRIRTNSASSSKTSLRCRG